MVLRSNYADWELSFSFVHVVALWGSQLYDSPFLLIFCVVEDYQVLVTSYDAV